MTPFKSTSPNLPRHAKDNQKRKPKPGDSARCGRAAPYDGPDYLEIAPSWRAMLEDSCPFSFYRISVDVAPQFESTVHNLNRAYLLILKQIWIQLRKQSLFLQL